MTAGTGAQDVDCSGFLGGRLAIWQPLRGYRAGIEPVLLAAAVPARPGERVLELGLGVGTASLCLAARVPGLHLTGVELHPAHAALARRNAAGNAVALEVIEADVAALPAGLRRQAFDQVLANPPFFPAGGRSAAADAGREAGRGESVPLALWIAAGLRRLRPGGWLTVLLPARRLPDLLAALPATGSELLPLAPRPGQEPRLAILRHRRASRAAFRLLAPLALHEGERHLRDCDDYAPWASAVLRGAAPLPWAEPRPGGRCGGAPGGRARGDRD